MSTVRLDESNTGSLPPPGDAVAVFLARADGPGQTPHFPLSRYNARARMVKTVPKPPTRGLFIRPRGSAGVGACLATALDSRWRTYRKQLRKCQKDFSAESVHQLRVATRRLMTQFSLLSCLASGDKAGQGRRKLKRRLKALGELRDTQVHRLYFEDHLTRFPELGLPLDFLQRRERRLVKTVAAIIQRLGTRKLERWTSSFREELESCLEHSQDRLAGKVFQATTDAFAEVVRLRRAIDPANSQTIHSTRVAFKKFRYLVEALSPNFTGLGKSQLRRFADYQRRMGDLQDLEMLQTFIARFIQERPETEGRLRSFCRYLRARRARKIRSVLKQVDDLYALWDPSRLDQRDGAALIATEEMNMAA